MNTKGSHFIILLGTLTALLALSSCSSTETKPGVNTAGAPTESAGHNVYSVPTSREGLRRTR